MSGQTDFLVQRFIENAPNSMAGGWIDLGVARDLKATEGDKAVQQLASTPGRHRAIRYDHVSEHEYVPGPGQVEPVRKGTETSHGIPSEVEG